MARPARETPVDSTGGTPVDDPGGTPVDNSVYDRLGGGWWDPDSVLVLTRTMVNPGRLPYLRRLVARLGIDPAASAASQSSTCSRTSQQATTSYDAAGTGSASARPSR